MRWLLLALLTLAAAPAAGGAELAYVRLTDGYWQVWSYDVASARHAQLTTGPSDKRSPAWGPDGTLVYRSNNDELHRLELPTGREQPWRQDAWPAGDPVWSPDGTRLAIARLRTELRDASAIWLLGPGAEQRRVLTVGPGFRMHPSWDPSGAALVYVLSFGSKGTQIRRVTLPEGEDELLHEDSFHSAYPSHAPDGNHIAFASDRSGDYEIWLRELESGKDTRLTRRRGLDTDPAWTPDGERIAFTSFRDGRLEIWWMKPDGTDARPLFEVDADVQDPAWR